MRRPVALTIAGSDSGGGAGIQADLKTFTAIGVYGMSVITAITAQNTVEVREVAELPVTLVRSQLDAVMSDIGAQAVKTGMLSSSELVLVVAEGIQRHGITRLVVDPVMVAKSGDRLLRDSAVQTLRDSLLPHALIVTPNVPEAEVLAGRAIVDESGMREAARAIVELGPRSVVMKGGHLQGADVLDLLFDGQAFYEFRSPRVATKNTHGTGCTLAAACAAYLALGHDVVESVRLSKEFVTGAILQSLDLGHGHGPLDHMWRQQLPGGH